MEARTVPPTASTAVAIFACERVACPVDFIRSVSASNGVIRLSSRLASDNRGRSAPLLWDATGSLINQFTPAECANYFAAAGYVPD
ncbi:hypothetical protein FJU11_11145 [Pararhizobium mangrovi]|uniref:Uncharacterized protein n=1 Tax=Pararhizobium mangrovi TaxID=2590452 RepID=A0A506TZN4_9HYPH|nr:hypothetical protein FJU11_11145 [Pararhizobium mangrovi]